jgi:hypothetical protein
MLQGIAGIRYACLLLISLSSPSRWVVVGQPGDVVVAGDCLADSDDAWLLPHSVSSDALSLADLDA